MLKKAGTIVALAAAGLLAMSPLALAGDRHHGHGGNVDVTDQENEQESAQGNGILNGNNVANNNTVFVCSLQVGALNNLAGALGATTGAAGIILVDGSNNSAAACSNTATAVGQSTTQDAENDND